MPDPIPYESFDPDSYRMSIGDHLDELRRRLILALIGFAVAMAGCLFFGREVMAFFCRPLIATLRQYDINPQMFFTNVSDPFMVYLKISMISAAVIASPWIIWQVWLFVAAGLYANERKTVTRYIPLSITLMLVGVLFVYYLVLPWTLQFFVSFSINIPLPEELSPVVSTQVPTTQADVMRFVETLPGDPASPQPYQIWFDTTQNRLKLFVGDKIRVLQFGAENLTSPMILLPDYVNLVLSMVLVFGLSFQLPLAVLALATLGIMEVETLRKTRKMVYFVMAILACLITPGDVITATVALMIPLCGLFELGLFLAARQPPRVIDLDETHR
jgi:sec-independent protein translocase protein TatC